MNQTLDNNGKTVGNGNLKPFPKGVSGNPKGRPKDTMKVFMARELREMSDNEKRAWLKKHKISGLDMWKMSEGNPATNMELSGEVTSKIVKLDE